MRVCLREVRNISFSENSVYVLNERTVGLVRLSLLIQDLKSILMKLLIYLSLHPRELL